MSLWRRIYRERRPILLPLVVCLVADVAVFVLGVLPLRRSVTNDETAALNSLVNLATARRADATAKDARAHKEQADLELKKFYGQVLPANASAAVNVVSSWLQNTAEAAGLQFKSSQTSRDQVRESRLTQVTSTVTLQGPYANIRRFLYAVETAPEFVVIETVRLAQPGVAQESAGGGLELVLDVATYYLTPTGTGAGAQ